jgi:hypothetical protein
MAALGETMFGDVLRGRRLGRLLEEAAWVRARQRLLIRRAASQVDPTLLWLPPPLAFAPEDVPLAARANERWFRVMKSSGVTLSLHPQGAAARQHALCAFASRHAEVLYARGGKARGVGHTLTRLMTFLEGTARAPGRNADPARLLEACEDWHKWAASIMAGDLARALELDKERVLPAPPSAGWHGAGVEVTPIRTLRELVRKQDGSLELNDVAGHSDRPPTSAEVEALLPWLRAALGEGDTFAVPG